MTEAQTKPSLLTQMGGVSGMVYAGLPSVVFVVANAAADLRAAVMLGVGAGAGIAGLRLLRREPLQPALSGLLGVAVGAVIAYPSTVRAKVAGATLGLVTLTALNLVRIMSLFWIGSAYPEYLDMAHLLVWQSAIILLAIVMWLIWAERTVGARKV